MRNLWDYRHRFHPRDNRTSGRVVESELTLPQIMTTSNNYHRLELAIANDTGDARRIMPVISAHHRTILDVGCGAGQTLIASGLASDVLAVGIDVDESALLLGRQLSHNVRFVCAKGEELSFESGIFDLVICRIALPYMHVSRAVSEVWRVLADGGDMWLVLHPFSTIGRELVGSIAHLKFKRSLDRLYVLTNGLALHVLGKQFRFPFNRDRYESFQTNHGIRRILTSAGFEQIEICRNEFYVVTAKKSLPGEFR